MTSRSSSVLAFARPYVRWRLRNAFDGVFVERLDELRALARREPLLFAANHQCWWDALNVLALDGALGTTGHALMDAANLRRLPFFGWLGAVPLERAHPRVALADMRRAAGRLDDPGHALWIFPQGTQRPAHLRPLGLHGGVSWLARKAGVRTVPISISYLYRQAPRPSVVIAVGDPLATPDRNATEWLTNLERALTQGLERCDRFVLSGAGSFTELVPPHRHSVDVPVAGRLLAAMMRGPGGQRHG